MAPARLCAALKDMPLGSRSSASSAHAGGSQLRAAQATQNAHAGGSLLPATQLTERAPTYGQTIADVGTLVAASMSVATADGPTPGGVLEAGCARTGSATRQEGFTSPDSSSGSLLSSPTAMTPYTMVERATTSPSPSRIVSTPVGGRSLPTVTPRHSERHRTGKDGSSTTDEDTMTKAMRRKAEAFSTPADGKLHTSKSFLSYSTPALSAKLSAVGVSLGRNDKEVVLSASILKHVEYDRRRVSPSVSNKPVASPIDDDDVNTTIDGQLLSSLVGVVSEIDLDETMPGSLYDLCASGRKSKSTSSSRASKRGRVPKSKIVS